MKLRIGIGSIALVILVACVLALEPAAAQVLYGTIVGAVRDPSGSAVPNATIKATNVGTGLVRETKPNEQGLYTFANAQPGTYDLEVTAAGFRAFSEKKVEVTINTVTRVDIALQVGEVTETVN